MIEQPIHLSSDVATQPPGVRAIGTALPKFVVRQSEAKAHAREHFSRGRSDAERLLSVFDNVQVERRHFCVPMDWFVREHNFSERNSLFVKEALTLSQSAIDDCFQQMDLSPADIDHLVLVTSSGVATPSLDAMLLERLGLPSSIRRTPIFGLGCAGGGAGLGLCQVLARGNPGGRILLVSVELSSLTFQPADFSKSNLVASALFSDGAAAVLIEGSQAPAGSGRVQLLAARSVTFPGTLDVMGWDFRQSGMQVIFSKSIPSLLRQHLLRELESFLSDAGTSLGCLDHFVLHPGGAKILEAYRDVLSLPAEQLEQSRYVLEQFGNMSAPTVLFILKRLLEHDPPPGLGLLTSFGPGFSAEMTLFRIV